MNRSAVFVANSRPKIPQSQRLYLLENFAEMNRKVRASSGKSRSQVNELKVLFEVFPFISHQVRKWKQDELHRFCRKNLCKLLDDSKVFGTKLSKCCLQDFLIFHFSRIVRCTHVSISWISFICCFLKFSRLTSC